MVPAAHGGDGAGSIRIPASCCGVFGLKPSRGRITLGPDLGESLAGIVNEHVLSMSVRDSAALLDATHGPMPGDPYFAPPPQRSYLAETGASPGRLRIAVTRQSLVGTAVHDDCVAAVDDAARLCADLGHEIVYLDPTFDAETYDRKYRRFWAMTATRSIWGIAERLGRKRDDVASETEAFNQYLYSVGSTILAADYVQDLVWFHAFSRGIARFMAPFDAWLTPTLGTPPPILGHFDGATHGGARVMDHFMEFLAFTTFANMAGLPSMSVPLSWNSGGLPVGSIFTAKYGEEAILFRLGAQLEKASPWAIRQPAIRHGLNARTA
jgi:amidase